MWRLLACEGEVCRDAAIDAGAVDQVVQVRVVCTRGMQHCKALIVAGVCAHYSSCHIPTFRHKLVTVGRGRLVP